MEYRKLPHGNEMISTLGLGMGYIHESSEKEIEETIGIAMERGINYFDMIASEDKPYKAYGRAFKGKREQIYLQMHIGAVYKNGKYGWSRNLDEIRTEFQSKLRDLGTDYTDVCMIHCMDDMKDFDDMVTGGLLDYAKELKKQGIAHYLGFSSHSPEVAKRFLDTGLMDIFMFSINAAYDYKKGDYARGTVDERMQLYCEAEKSGVGITVMKPFGGGQLLNANTSPFKRELTKNQCIKYALDRPAVLTVLPGIRGKKDLMEVLAYNEATDIEKDYSVIGEFTSQSSIGNCVYCNHCQPCPQGINIGLINKYYDLAKAGDKLAINHYEKLPLHAKDCIKCGHCEERCPFSVKQESRMEEIKKFFGI